jgi:hypothetical protein
MCVNKPYSVCCTLWCAFGTVFLTLFYFLGHYDGPCVGNASKCNGNYFIAGVTRPELTSQAVGDLFGGVALGYLFCTLLASGFWVYHDYVKKAVGKRRPYGATTEDVEFSGACVRACARARASLRGGSGGVAAARFLPKACCGALVGVLCGRAWCPR